MKDSDAPPPIAISGPAPSPPPPSRKDSSEAASSLGKGGYKFWVLAAIVLLAFWSMFTGSVSLKWSAGSLARFPDDVVSPLLDDLDILEMEEREKVVKRMWDVYTHSKTIRLPKFWLQAFEAAYEELASDVPGVRGAAVSEIAKMSLRSLDFDPPPLRTPSASTLRLPKGSHSQRAKGRKEVM